MKNLEMNILTPLKSDGRHNPAFWTRVSQMLDLVGTDPHDGLLLAAEAPCECSDLNGDAHRCYSCLARSQLADLSDGVWDDPHDPYYSLYHTALAATKFVWREDIPDVVDWVEDPQSGEWLPVLVKVP